MVDPLSQDHPRLIHWLIHPTLQIALAVLALVAIVYFAVLFFFMAPYTYDFAHFCCEWGINPIFGLVWPIFEFSGGGNPCIVRLPLRMTCSRNCEPPTYTDNRRSSWHIAAKVNLHCKRNFSEITVIQGQL